MTSPRAPQGGDAAQGHSDPLAELARLIGQSDPFADREAIARCQISGPDARIGIRMCRIKTPLRRRVITPRLRADPSAGSVDPRYYPLKAMPMRRSRPAPRKARLTRPVTMPIMTRTRVRWTTPNTRRICRPAAAP